MVELFRSRCLVATVKITSAFRRIVSRAAIISIATRATRCLYVSSRKYSACQASSLELHFTFSGTEDLEILRSRSILTCEVVRRATSVSSSSVNSPRLLPPPPTTPENVKHIFGWLKCVFTRLNAADESKISNTRFP